MKINSLDKPGFVVSIDRTAMAKRVKKEGPADKLDISDEAKKISQSNTSLTSERIELIRQRIAENFYDQDDVLNEVAERMMKSKELREFLQNLRPDQNS